MLAIAQIEVQVKTFWSDIYEDMPKAEVGNVGMTFAESEVRHMDAYSHLLDVLGIEDEFEEITEVPAIQQRIEYLDEYLEMGRSENKKESVMGILLFSTFVEHVSLFSQFLIMTSFDKHEKKFKGIANAVEATSKEEQIHGLFGQELVETIREENPDLFDDDFSEEIEEACQQAYEAESEILDWIFADGELDFLPREHVDAFLKDRFNQSLDNAGIDPVFDPDEEVVDETRWFHEDIMMTKDNDFFSKRSTTYNKHTQSVTADDMF
jgi:ribonucleoside-diphosphate reductase beta chain